jgi:N-acyl-D-amino-acid deacylase
MRRRRRRNWYLLPLLLVAGLIGWYLWPRLSDIGPDPFQGGAPQEPFDLIIRGGMVYDGSGAAPRRADVGIRGSKIATIGSLEGRRANQVIDAAGMAVAPGFIDPHNHTWDTLPEYPTDPDAKSMVMQGITTVLGGVDGRSRWPIGSGLQVIERQGTGVNFGSFIGQWTVREQVVGWGRLPASAQHLEHMQAMVQQAMREGAFGLSTGLEYEGGAAQTAELIALARAAAAEGGIYSTHVRGERTDLLTGVAEALQIGREAKIAVNLSHLKLLGSEQWGQLDQLVDMIEQARRSGLKVVADVYPYLAPDYAMNLLLAEAYQRYPAQTIQIRYAADPRLMGQSLTDAAAARGQTPTAAARALLAVDPTIRVAVEMAQEGQMLRLIGAAFSIASTDGEAQPYYEDPDKAARLVHPRSYGSYPKLLRYAREGRTVSLPQMVRKLSGATADAMQIADRGYVREGYYADLVIFDPSQVAEQATWARPQAYPVGIQHVLVNGKFAVRDGAHLPAARHGTILRKGAR